MKGAFDSLDADQRFDRRYNMAINVWLICWAIIIAAIVLWAALAKASTCIPSGVGYVRQHRPNGYTPIYDPSGDPRCNPYARETLASNTPLCFQCHPHKYEPWRV